VGGRPLNSALDAMLRIVVALLFTLAAVLSVFAALKTGRVSAKFFTQSDFRARHEDPPTFWFFTAIWGVFALIGFMACFTLLGSLLFGLGKPLTPQFLDITIQQWPFAIVALYLVYLIIQILRSLLGNGS
jgi:hypothetical protein